VEALRKEISERETYGDDSFSTENQERNGSLDQERSISMSSIEMSSGQTNIDTLFDRSSSRSDWKPQQPPEVLGELLESRYMLPLLLPSDPRMLAMVPSITHGGGSPNSNEGSIRMNGNRSRSRSRMGNDWVSRSKQVREVKVEMLDWLDGTQGANRWTRRSEVVEVEENAGEGAEYLSDTASSAEPGQNPDSAHVHLTRMSRAASSRSRAGRGSGG